MIYTRKRKITQLHTRAVIDGNSYDEKERTVNVVFATDASVRMYDWDIGEFNEILSFDKNAMRMDRINAGAPVLDSHSAGSIKNQLGTVVRAWVEKGKGMATLKLSSREDVAPYVQDIKDGILKNISVGYRVHKYRDDSAEDDKIPTLTAVDWEPGEISFTPVPADFQAGVRKSKKNQPNEVKIYSKKRSTMAKKTVKTTKKVDLTKLTPVERKAYEEKQTRIAEKRALAVKEGNKEGQRVERKRINLITSAFTKAGIDTIEYGKMLRKFIKDGVSVASARKQIIDLMASEDYKKAAKVRQGHRVLITGEEEVEKKATAISDAIMMRAAPEYMVDDKGKRIELSDTAKKYRFLSLIELSRQLLNESGISTDGLAPVDISRMAMFGQDKSGRALTVNNGSGRAYMSISDFPIILGNTINRTLRQAYDLAPRTFMPFCKQGTAKDFRPMTRVQTGDTSAFKVINEGEEYVQGTYGEGKEVYSVLKYGRKIGLTWEMLINDDLSAFNRIPESIAQMAAQKQSDIVYAILTGNPNMQDGVALFNSAHANLAATGAVIDVTGLSKMRKAMRLQKSLGGNYLNLSPKFLIVGATLEQVAYQYTSVQYVPTTQSNIAPNYNTALQVIVEPRLDALNSGLSWFGAAAPQGIDTIEYSFLEGDGELFTETRVGFDVDGIETKARMVFGAKALDYRGLYKNAGA